MCIVSATPVVLSLLALTLTSSSHKMTRGSSTPPQPFSQPEIYSVFDEGKVKVFPSSDRDWISLTKKEERHTSAYAFSDIASKLQADNASHRTYAELIFQLFEKLPDRPQLHLRVHSHYISRLKEIAEEQKTVATHMRELPDSKKAHNSFALYGYFVYALVCEWATVCHTMMETAKKKDSAEFVKAARHRGELTTSLILLAGDLGVTMTSFSRLPNVLCFRGLQEVKQADDSFILELISNFLPERSHIFDIRLLHQMRNLCPETFAEDEEPLQCCKNVKEVKEGKKAQTASKTNKTVQSEREIFKRHFFCIFESEKKFRARATSCKEKHHDGLKCDSGDPITDGWFHYTLPYSNIYRKNESTGLPFQEAQPGDARIAHYYKMVENAKKRIQVSDKYWELAIWSRDMDALDIFTARQVFLTNYELLKRQDEMLGKRKASSKSRLDLPALMRKRDQAMEFRVALGFCTLESFEQMKKLDAQLFPAFPTHPEKYPPFKPKEGVVEEEEEKKKRKTRSLLHRSKKKKTTI